MHYSPVEFSLPVADRRVAHDFYRDGFGLRVVGEAAEDGLPEPLRFALNEHTLLTLVPSGGFDWVIGGHHVAPPGSSECLLSVVAESSPEVDALVDRARRAGATVVAAPDRQPWGYSAVLADPDSHLWMVTAATNPAPPRPAGS